MNRPVPSRFNVLNASAITAALLAGSASIRATTNLSVWAYPGPSGRMICQPDALGNRILDTSGVGYQGGAVPLPNSNTVPVKVTISPVVGDNVANLQNAINQVAALPLDTNGYRGVVLLTAGLYPLSKTVTISASGVVLRGVGSSTNGTGTVLEATATNQYTLIEVQGSSSSSSGTSHNITNFYVPVGSRSFYVDNASGFSVGNWVYVRRVATSNWIHDLGMDLLGPPPDVPWTPSGYNIDMERLITHIEGNHIFVDAPITCAIDSRYTNGTLRTASWPGRIQNVGIEHIYAKSDYFGSNTNETHGWTFIQLDRVQNGWVRDVVSQFFGYSCVNINSGDKFITVQDCQCLDPVSIITGGRRYAFAINDAQYCLVKNCYTRQDRHQFVTQSLTIGPSAFVDGLSDNAHAEAGPHQRWATGILWDNITVHGGNNDIQNAGNYGTGHGWEGANCLIWNNAANGFIVQNPPGARNWLIGSIGLIQNGTAWNIGYTNMPHAPGTYDSSGSSGTNVFPDSLYFGQVQDRLAQPNLQSRDYWLGNINAFSNAPAGDSVTVDPAWRAVVQAAAGGQPLDPFDIVTNNHWVPFTFNFSLSPTEHVVAATLALSMLATNSAAADLLYLDSLTNAFNFSSLGWLPVSTVLTNPTVRVLDLYNQLPLLTNGQLNVAVQGDIGIDWAMLEVQVAPNNNASPNVLSPVADATVRGGVNAAINYGTATTLTARQDSSANNVQQAYLRWDLSTVTGRVFQARVRLTPVNVGTNGIEQGVAVATSDNWTENGITWNNQPGAGERFATWIPATNGPVSFDVTPQILDALTGDKQLSLELFSLYNVGSAGSVDYASREYSDPNSRPQLLVWLSGSPPAISALTNVTIPINGSTGPIPFTIGDAESPPDALTLSAASSNPSLVPNANIIFGGSGSNRAVTVTAAANQSGQAVITVMVTDPGGSLASSAFTLTVQNHAPGVFVWNGPGAGLNNWSVPGNWSPAGPPDIFDDVKFFDTGAAGVGVSNINNLMDANSGGLIASLQYGNTNGNHTTFIPSGATLTIAGANGLFAGTETDNGSAQTVSATITGPGGTLTLANSGANLIVRQASATNGSQRATLDLSGLGTFNAALNQVLVGFVGPVNRATGTLYLGKTNTVTATGSPGVGAGDNNSNNGGQQFIYLGQTNAFFVDSIVIARQKATATFKFNPALVNPAAYFRASDGASPVASWNIADNSLQSTSSSSSVGTNDFTGGTLDALVDSMVVGKSQKTTGANSTGVLTFTAGTLNVNTLQIGFQAASGATSAGIGRVNVNGPAAQLVVNDLLELGHTSGGSGTTNTYGTLAINGGTVEASAIAAGASVSNTLVIANGTLELDTTAGAPGLPINNVALTNATLQLSPAAGVTNLVAGMLVTGGASNAITIVSLPNIMSFPAQFALVSYSGALAGSGYNFVLQPLPAGSYCGGYLSNHLATASIDLVITNCLVPDPFLTWDGTFSADWDTETANWKNNLGPDLTYADGTAVVFNDTATGPTTVNLTDAIMPASVTVSNSARTYIFAGPGNLTGATALLKQGNGTLVLDNNASNDFAGGITISAGALQIGNSDDNGNLPPGPVTDNANLVFNQSGPVTVANSIAGSGSLSQNGTNVLTLAGANTFTGGVTVVSGTLQIGNAAALGVTNGITTVASGATLDFNHITIGLEPVTVSGAGVGGGGALVDNSGNGSFLSPQTLAYVTLTGDTTFGGTGRWDLRSATTTVTNAALGTGGHPYKLTKTGTNQVSLVGVSVDPALGDIDVQAGILSVEKVTSSLGNPAYSLSVSNGATLQFYQVSNVFIKPLILKDGATVLNNNGSNTYGGPVTLLGSNTFNAGGTWLKFTNTVTGPGSLTKVGTATLFLTGSNAYLGNTWINTGTLALAGVGSVSSTSNITIAAGATLDVSARSDGKFTLVSGQTLQGNGTLNGSLLAAPGATVSPGPSIGALIVTNAVTLQGTSSMELDKLNGTNDSIQGAASIVFGGTLSLSFTPGTLAAGDSFRLFSAASYSGSFTNLVPAVPGAGLAWDTTQLTTNGTLKVATLRTPPAITSIILAGGALVITGTNGTPSASYYLLATTNVAQPLTNWTRLLTNAFDPFGNFISTNALNPGVAQEFYRLQVP